MSRREPGHNEAAVFWYRGMLDGKDRFDAHFNGRHFWHRGVLLDAGDYAGSALEGAGDGIEFEPSTLVRPGGFLYLGHTRMSLALDVTSADDVPLSVSATLEFSLRRDAVSLEALVSRGVIGQLGKLLAVRLIRAVQNSFGAVGYQDMLARQDELHAQLERELRVELAEAPGEGRAGLGVALSSVNLSVEKGATASELASELRQSGVSGGGDIASVAQVVATHHMAQASRAHRAAAQSAQPVAQPVALYRPVEDEVLLSIFARNAYPQGDPRYGRRRERWMRTADAGEPAATHRPQRGRAREN